MPPFAPTFNPLSGESHLAAGARVIVKRTMRIHGAEPAGMTPDTLSFWAIAHPELIGQVVAQWFDRAAKAWIDGNNSGDPDILDDKEQECDRLRDQASHLLHLYGVSCDFPGLYPTLHDQRSDRTCYDSTESGIARFLGEIAQ